MPLGEREGPVVGTYRAPLILGLYADSPPTPPYGRDEVQTEFFDGPNSRNITITEFYSELSNGRVTLLGETFGWARSALSEQQVAGNSNGLDSSGRVGDFILEVLGALDDGSIDWGRYDNDGPDGVPNSGDDDGFVDVLAVMHPTSGAECGGNNSHVWSHKWTLTAAAGRVYVTSTESADGGRILIDDYTIQPVLNCAGTEINEIGVFAHELGHGFGLPDLYAVNGDHAGIGRWGLMGSGSWGCGGLGSGPDKPCHMSAWSKVELGWSDVVELPFGADHGTVTLDPVESGGAVLKVPAGDGSRDYYLLEFRDRVGTDVTLPEPGVLIWQIDQDQLDATWFRNNVNTDPNRMGVWLR
ncbi:MAG: M6 family metalloprotease domain-containing protein, partial [Gemmatimonadetes bacterium]